MMHRSDALLKVESKLQHHVYGEKRVELNEPIWASAVSRICMGFLEMLVTHFGVRKGKAIYLPEGQRL